MAENNNKKDWHIRFFVTNACNLSCIYCNPEKKKESRPIVNTSEVSNITLASFNAGIKRIHWTGGEPTVRKDIQDIIQKADTQGYIDQVMTTNGIGAALQVNRMKQNGLRRLNVSVDTLDRKKYEQITGKDSLEEVLHTIDIATEILPEMTKINLVVMRNTINDIPSVIDYAQSIYDKRPGKIGLKLIALFANNPAMISKSGQEMYKELQVTHDEIISTLNLNRTIKKLSYGEIIGDNPNAEYYTLDSGMSIGVIAMPSWNYRCAGSRCKKLRITPYGEVKGCLQDRPVMLVGKSIDEQTEIIKNIMMTKEQEDVQGKIRIHYNDNLGSVRFGNVSFPIPYSVFQNIENSIKVKY